MSSLSFSCILQFTYTSIKHVHFKSRLHAEFICKMCLCKRLVKLSGERGREETRSSVTDCSNQLCSTHRHRTNRTSFSYSLYLYLAFHTSVPSTVIHNIGPIASVLSQIIKDILILQKYNFTCILRIWLCHISIFFDLPV